MPTNDILLSPKLEAFRRKFIRLTDVRAPTECWPWLGSFDLDLGYGKVMLDLQRHRTHRVAWVLGNGHIPMWSATRSMAVCHECDNRICVNLAHLWLGTDADNAKDCTSKGRMAQGETHYMAKLTAEQVRAIRADSRSGRVVALDYGVTHSTVWWVRQPNAWKSVV